MWMLIISIFTLSFLDVLGMNQYNPSYSECINALRVESMHYGMLGISNSATVDISSLAKLEDLAGYSVDTGNYDLCMRQERLWHCLAGSIKTTGEVDDAFGGVCVPTSCQPEHLAHRDIHNYLQESIDNIIFGNKNLLITPHGQQLFQYYLKLNNTLQMAINSKSGYTCGDHRANMTLDRYLFFIVFSALIITVMICTIYQMSTASDDVTETIITQTSSSNNNNTNHHRYISATSQIRHNNNNNNVVDSLSNYQTSTSTSTTKPILNRIIECFSLVKNIKFIFERSSRKHSEIENRFAMLDGLKALSILWIILAHTLAVSLSLGMLNPAAVLPPEGFLRHISAQIFFSSRFAVDTFFFISGFLVAFTLLKKLAPVRSVTTPSLETEHGSISSSHYPYGREFPKLSTWLPAFYLHRLWRILPPYVFCLVLWWKIGVLLGRGPYWFRWLSFTRRCDMYWWTNLLFINNLIPYDIPETDQCFYISWYLANDMQFYFISPFLLLIYLYNNKYGLLITSLICIISMILSGYVTWKYDLSPHTFDGRSVQAYSRIMYTKPQYRISTYLIGMIAGMIWHRKITFHPRLKLHSSLSRAYLIGSSVVLLYLMFGSFSAYQHRPCLYTEPISSECGSNWSLTARVLYNVIVRPLWAICLAILTLLSGNNQGGPVQSFLSHSFWTAPAKVTFSVFLLHVLVINIWFLGNTQKPRYSHFNLAMTYCGVVFMSFIAGLFVTVFVESPSAKLWRTIQEFVLQFSDDRQPNNLEPNQRQGYESVIMRSRRDNTESKTDHKSTESSECAPEILSESKIVTIPMLTCEKTKLIPK